MSQAEATQQVESTITYLQMLEPPPRPLKTTPEGVTVMQAHKLTVSFYRYLYNTVGEPWLWTDRRKLSDEVLLEIIQHPQVDLYVLYVAGVPAGYAELDRRVPDEMELAYFGLMPDFIGRKLGAYLLDFAIGKAWETPLKRMWLHTCTLDHPKALETYIRAGFVAYKQETQRDTVMPDGSLEPSVS